MVAKSILLVSKCTWNTSLLNELPVYGPMFIRSMIDFQSISKEVHQLCTPLWEQLRKWIACCSVRSKWPNEIIHLHKGLNDVWGFCCSLGSILLWRELVNPKRKVVGSTSIHWAAMSLLPLPLFLMQLNQVPWYVWFPAHGLADIDQEVAMVPDVSRNFKWAIWGPRQFLLIVSIAGQCYEIKKLYFASKFSEFYSTCLYVAYFRMCLFKMKRAKSLPPCNSLKLKLF